MHKSYHTNGRRAIRIAGCSGSVLDRRDSLRRLAASEEVDCVIGDWMSEYNMSARGADKIDGHVSYEPSIMEALEPALETLNATRKKFVCNAGASDTPGLSLHVRNIIRDRGLHLKVACITGDEVLEQVTAALDSGDGSSFIHLSTDQSLDKWSELHKPVYAQAYLGCFGIVKALELGADLVICGRVADASSVIGLAAWWHGWARTDFYELGGAFVAGHLIECSNYVTGGNFSGFKTLKPAWSQLGYPIAEVASDGSVVITKERDSQGVVTIETVKTQLVYEIQGPLYYNSDVCVDLTEIAVEEVSANRIAITGFRSIPPPPLTKVGITARTGYQAEMTYYLCGLDIKEKAAMVEAQVRAHLNISRLSLLKFGVTGTAAIDPQSQDEATVELRIFAQSKYADAFSPQNFMRPISDQMMQSYPGATFGIDSRKSGPKAYYEYFATLLPQSQVNHVVQLEDGEPVQIPAPSVTEPFRAVQDSYETRNPVKLSSFGLCQRAALGLIVHARSGDKGSDANVGFYVRHADEWDWLRSLLTIDKIKQLLGNDHKGKRIDRFEMPNLWAVHFLLKDHLDRGVASTSTYDYLGKNVAEYLRAKHVDIPIRFLNRGSI